MSAAITAAAAKPAESKKRSRSTQDQKAVIAKAQQFDKIMLLSRKDDNARFKHPLLCKATRELTLNSYGSLDTPENVETTAAVEKVDEIMKGYDANGVALAKPVASASGGGGATSVASAAATKTETPAVVDGLHVYTEQEAGVVKAVFESGMTTEDLSDGFWTNSNTKYKYFTPEQMKSIPDLRSYFYRLAEKHCPKLFPVHSLETYANQMTGQIHAAAVAKATKPSKDEKTDVKKKKKKTEKKDVSVKAAEPTQSKEKEKEKELPRLTRDEIRLIKYVFESGATEDDQQMWSNPYIGFQDLPFKDVRSTFLQLAESRCNQLYLTGTFNDWVETLYKHVDEQQMEDRSIDGSGRAQKKVKTDK